MHSLITRAVAVAGMAAAVSVLGSAPANAEPLSGCVGLPDSGGIYYHCLTIDPMLLPSVSLDGSTPVGTTVPAFCYFLGCTEPTPVGTSVPVRVSTTSPSNDVTVFEFGYSCTENYWYGTSCDRYYRIRYDHWARVCRFETNDSSLSALNEQSVFCML